MKNLEKAFALFDAYNRNSPEHLIHEGTDYPVEYFYAVKLYEWVTKLAPDASEGLLLASRAQHIGRWEIARNSYPEGRVGYLKWRTDLSKFHASKAAEILGSVGYDSETIERVQQIIRKQGIKADPEIQTMENALCLVFLQYQYDNLIGKTSEEKMINILQKTWAKMSDPGRNMALSLHYSDEGKRLINMALNAG
ncbi:DUF4202 domain-containing protein [Dyadobacter chenwenxiniae]|uniref:DUF4202 domain-containing protein n=1 Tax=Dyadobacter chenwenxiniae TaxID=2906456 RepID=A0A9X1PLK5_9BACT|nr:DUF4202 domain-containing protein [Dyadobacter chenwenxiniae]MCF0062479.1 DUF4202 domain-containing protein [Dyadobacter chenwenxiniae]UON83773.1 DUF4202 domain-containing protein [Dyadobacter chenwenxiniae]